jgi:uncharacterized protein (UPF0548 family)
MAEPSKHPKAPIHPRWYASAFLGAAAWLAVWFVAQPDWAPAILLLGPLVVVPLGLALLDGFEDRRGIAAVAQLITALCFAVSFLFPAPGPVAGAWTLPWIVFTAWLAWKGATAVWRGGSARLEDLCLYAGLIFIPIGSVWAAASRYGVQPMGFGEPIVLLTAAHFHYAGFALPILTGLAARELRTSIGRVAAGGVLAGVPLVAVGITVGRWYHWVELLAAWELSAASLLVASLQFRLACQSMPTIARSLLVVSAASLVAGMALAAIYALGTYLGRWWLDVPTMIRWHASINALGFALPGVLAWGVIGWRAGPISGRGLFLLRLLGQQPCLEDWEARPIAPAVASGSRPSDAHDTHERIVAHESPGPPEPGGPFEILAQAIRSYRIFPESMLERVVRREPVEVGDTVGGCYHLFPGIDLFFASRVTAFLDGREGGWRRAGFTYQTLAGHLEAGEETFCVEKDEATGQVRVALRSWSRPGSWLTRIGYPYARRCQLRAGRAALDNLGQLVSRDRSPAVPTAG